MSKLSREKNASKRVKRDFNTEHTLKGQPLKEASLPYGSLIVLKLNTNITITQRRNALKGHATKGAWDSDLVNLATTSSVGLSLVNSE